MITQPQPTIILALVEVRTKTTFTNRQISSSKEVLVTSIPTTTGLITYTATVNAQTITTVTVPAVKVHFHLVINNTGNEIKNTTIMVGTMTTKNLTTTIIKSIWV